MYRDLNRKLPPLFMLSVLLYGGLRVFILLTNFDAVAHHGYELYPMGCMAKDIIEGGGFPLRGYLETHAGGFLVTGIAAVPFYLLLGSNYLALKMVPFLFGVAVLGLLYFFLRTHFSPSTAALGAFLFALAPTTLTKHSVIAMGNHFEIILFIMLSLFSLYREDFATFGQDDVYDQSDAAGFINLFSLPLKVKALIDRENGALAELEVPDYSRFKRD